MFWGLILEPNKRYSQTVEKSFHVSMASLNLPLADDNVVQVMLYYENSIYLLCNLKKSSTWQVPLDLNFQEGTTIAFVCHGQGQVHLTGYLIPDDDQVLDELEEEEEEEEEEDEAPQLVAKQSKRKAVEFLKKNVKRPKQKVEPESSDEEVELDGTNEGSDSDGSEEEVDELLLNEDEDTDEDEEDEDADDDVEQKKVMSQQKDKRNKQQQQQQQQKKKEEKKKLVNGKEVKQKKNKGEQQQNDLNVQSEHKKRVVEGGVQTEDLKVGNGAPAKSGKFVSVYYVGRLKNGKKFDSTVQGDGFKFRLGKGEVIKGWDIGIIGMKVGGKRRITIPPTLAYGAKGSPPVIPGNSTLIFEVELRNVH